MSPIIKLINETTGPDIQLGWLRRKHDDQYEVGVFKPGTALIGYATTASPEESIKAAIEMLLKGEELAASQPYFPASSVDELDI